MIDRFFLLTRMLLLCLLLSTAHAQATAFPTGAAQIEQREIFNHAEHALKQQRYHDLRTLMPQLKEYPLYPFLVYGELLARLHQLPTQDVTTFLNQYDESVFAVNLRRAWLAELFKQKQWSLFIQHYPSGSQDPISACQYAQAQWQRDPKQMLADTLKTVWLSAKSLPKECDQPIATWFKKGLITRDLRWQRLDLVMNAAEIKLAQHIAKSMNKSDASFVHLWIELKKNPAQLIQDKTLTALKKADQIIRDQIVDDVWQTWYQKSSTQALQQASLVLAEYPLSTAETAKIHERVGLQLAVQYDPASLQWFEKIPAKHINKSIQEWRVRVMLYQQNWPKVTTFIQAMDPLLRQDPTWQYWQARAHDALGEKTQATTLYQQAATKRHFYGMLASEKLGLTYSLNENEPSITQPILKQTYTHPGIASAVEWLARGEIANARRQWQYTIARLTMPERQAAVQIAQTLQWYDRVILTALQADSFDDIKARFPLAYKQEMLKTAQQHGLDPAWTFALARQESMFINDARSSAGALGLLQLMPKTAHMMARRNHIPLKHDDALFDPHINLQLGGAYLRDMLQQHQGNIMLTTAAYNAGPGAVRRWIPEADHIPADIWIETVPYYETRDYIKNVLSFSVIYDHHLGNKQASLKNRMQTVQAKN